MKRRMKEVHVAICASGQAQPSDKLTTIRLMSNESYIRKRHQNQLLLCGQVEMLQTVHSQLQVLHAHSRVPTDRALNS